MHCKGKKATYLKPSDDDLAHNKQTRRRANADTQPSSITNDRSMYSEADAVRDIDLRVALRGRRQGVRGRVSVAVAEAANGVAPAIGC